MQSLPKDRTVCFLHCGSSLEEALDALDCCVLCLLSVDGIGDAGALGSLSSVVRCAGPCKLSNVTVLLKLAGPVSSEATSELGRVRLVASGTSEIGDGTGIESICNVTGKL